MEVEKFRGLVAAVVAAVCVIGGAAGAAWAWYASSVGGMTTDLALILSVFTGLIGSGSTFLFVAEGASRATYAAERSFASGSYAGSVMPEQAKPAPAPAEPARSGAAPGGPADGPLDDAEAPPTP